MNDESLEELVRAAAPRQAPESLRARLVREMSAEAGARSRAPFRRHLSLWPAMAAAAASLAVAFLWPLPSPRDSLPQAAVRNEPHPAPVLLQTRTIGRSEPAGNVRIGDGLYQVTKKSEINIREYAHKTLGKIEAYSFFVVSYEAKPLVIR